MESVDHFKTSARAYCLVVYNDQQDDSAHIEALADVAWTKVFDFDPNSRESCTFSRCEVPLRNQRSLYITTCRDNAKSLHDKATEWFFPIDDLNVGEREWKKSVGEIINSHIEKLADFCCRRRPLTVVVMWYGSYKCLPHLNRLLDKMDERITDGVKFVFCLREKPNDETTLQKFNEMCSELEVSDADIHIVPLATMCQQLQHQASNKIPSRTRYMLPALTERVLTKVEIEQKDVAWLAEELDVLYLEQDHSVSFQGNRNDLGREFYHGGTISWFELQLGTYAVDRDIQFALEASIKTVLNRRKSAIKTLYHAPGAGGTTLARRVLWDIHLEKICPCAFVTSLAHDNDAIHKRIKWLHNKTSLPVFVVEDSRISKTESRLIRETFETCRQFTPLVILDVQRYSSKIDKDKEGDRFWLKGEVSIPEAIRLTEVFSRNCPEKKDDFEKLVDDAKAHKNPRVFEFGLTAFEYEFRGVQSYVSGYLKLDGHFNLLKDLSDWRLAVGFLSLTYYYGQAAIPGQFFANILGIRKKDTVDFGSLPFEAKKFINKEDGNYWRISIHALAKEILEQILCPVPHSRESNVRLSSSATKCLKEFTAMFIIEAGSGKERLCQDLINVVIATFFSRDNNEILMIGRTKRHLSSLILDIPSQRPLYTERYAIFQLLVEYFPRNPHCLAHLARFCALVREEYPVAKKYIEKAIQIREEERQQYHHYMAASFEEGIEEDSQGADTPLSRIYNMKGCIYQAEMSSNIGRLGSVATCEEHIDVNEVITEAVALAKTASTAFAKCREYYKKGHEDSFGYVPDIKLRLKLIEFIKKNFGDYETYVGSESADEYIKDLLWEVDSLIRECYEKVFTLPQEFHTSVDWYCLLCKDAALAIQNWTDVSSIRGRRGKLAAYRMLNQSRSAVKNIWYWDNMRKSDIEDIITLYEQNFQEVFEKGLDYNLDNDMKDWLLAIRHELIERPYTIEEVLLRVRQWYDRRKSPYSVYYLYVLTAVLAIGTKGQTGSRGSFAEMKRLQPLLKRASLSIGRPKLCREYVTSSSCGIKRLGHNQEHRNWDPDSRNWKFKGELDSFTGTIRECHSNAKGTIEMDMGRVADFDCIKVFFVPAASGFWDRRYVNTRVQFLLGFSFESGPEAFNVTELKRFKCTTCGKTNERATDDAVPFVYCSCGFPINVRRQVDDYAHAYSY
ncbi:sterile alpha motif domain-containing protein 9-like [Branchiostoma floridae]|uniref:Sterile alpha motif domain-containing protein 9-like n=1 Tax=Branchiostoma floridae TaxID=7739 RepID=A0A9J7N900_BRAFL|nr:sterile alpha motif domain-containing protein 9-like [Branchiostoma floridae]